jgi:hypothetical protein
MPNEEILAAAAEATSDSKAGRYAALGVVGTLVGIGIFKGVKRLGIWEERRNRRAAKNNPEAPTNAPIDTTCR